MLDLETLPAEQPKIGTFISYFGGKSGKLAGRIIELFPPHANFVDAFGGGGGVILNKTPAKQEVYNDLSRGMTNLFRVVRNHDKCRELYRMLQNTAYGRDEWRLAMRIHNDRENYNERGDVELAWATYVNLAQSFTGTLTNGGWSFGGPKHDSNLAAGYRNNLKKLVAVRRRLQNVYIENKPAQLVIAQWDYPDTLFYLDPPYLPETRSKKGKGSGKYEHEMTTEEHVNLLDQIKNLKGMVFLSGYPSQLYDEALAGWERYQWEVIASSAVITTGNGRKERAQGNAKRTEVLWINPQAAARMLKRPPNHKQTKMF